MAACSASVASALQVSAFGSDTQTDGGDVWSIEWDTKSKHWKQDAKVGSRGQRQHTHAHVLCSWQMGMTRGRADGMDATA